jgi:cold shock CspA family protein
MNTMEEALNQYSIGKIKKIFLHSKYGFIDTGETELFFHKSSVDDPAFEELKVGNLVQFKMGKNKKGICAANIIQVKKID